MIFISVKSASILRQSFLNKNTLIVDYQCVFVDVVEMQGYTTTHFHHSDGRIPWKSANTTQHFIDKNHAIGALLAHL